MDKRRANSPASRRRALLVAGWWALVTGCIGWAGCSVEKHYDLLSFFFDGVPNPNALPISGDTGNPATMRLSATYTAHPPYLEQRCDACHLSRFTRGGVTSEVCANCHEGIQDQYRKMHGPVALGACLWCHVGHESAFSSLLKAEPRTVCTQCHEAALLSADRVPEHADESWSCLTCHMGHGGEERLMLKDLGESEEERGG